MKTEFEHENNTNYLVIQPESESYEGYQLKMLLNNDVKYLLPVMIRRINNKQCYYYNITSRQQMTKYYEVSKMKWDDVRQICISIAGLVMSIDKYMLDLDSIILKPEYMYIDLISKQFYFIYNPDEQHNYRDSLRSLFEYILEHFDHSSDKKDVLRVYQIYQDVIHGETDLGRLINCCENDDFIFSINGDSDNDKELYIKDNENMYEYPNLEDSSEHKANSKLEGKVIDTVESETIVSETEDINKTIVSVLSGLRIVGVIIMLFAMLELFLPQYAPVILSLPIILVLLAIGLLLFWQCHSRLKKKASLTRINHSTEKQPYMIPPNKKKYDTVLQDNTVNYQVEENSKFNEDQCIHNEHSVNYYKKKSNKDKSTSHIPVEESCNTVLLTDYLAKEQSSKHHFMYLVPQTEDTKDAEETGMDQKQKIIKFPCVMGSLDGYCDVVIHNELISRMHLCIRQIGEEWFIEDMNSTNGTYINNNRIKPNQQLKLSDGDLIRLAVVSYKVEIS